MEPNLSREPSTPDPRSEASLDMGGAILWDSVLADLKNHFPQKSFDEFFAPTRASYFDGHSLVVEVPSAFHRGWLMQHGLERLQRALEAQMGGRRVALELHICAEGQLPAGNWDPRAAAMNGGKPTHQRPQNGNGHQAYAPYVYGANANGGHQTPDPERERHFMPGANGSGNGNGSGGNGHAQRRPPQSLAARHAAVGFQGDHPWATSSPAARGKTNLNPRSTFENFVIGESNRFAQAAALKASDPTSRQFNPLFLYGGVGLGKTHLMQAIGQEMLRNYPDKRVLYVTSEQFMNDFIDALTSGVQMEFRSLYRNVDLLLVDDVQFFIGKEQTQAEFFYTFNELYEAGKKIVFSSDRQPKELVPLEERLRSRFEWGLTVDIQMPDVETRAAIVQKKAALEGVNISQDVVFHIAERVQSHVRELEGALARLIAYSNLQERPIDMEMCVDLLGHIVYSPEAPEKISVEDIQRAVCGYFTVSLEDLIGPSRVKQLTRPRHIAQYLARQLTGLSYPEISHTFNRRDHTSILHACRKVERELERDAQLANCVTFLTKQLRNGDGHKKR
jgi:chromosomal replication initiator protein